MKLSKAQFCQLNAFSGYGDFKNAEIIYFGLEEGLGQWDVESNIIARCEYYGKEPSLWFDASSRQLGYFERSGDKAAMKMKQCLRDLEKITEEKRVKTTIQSLEYMSRLSLFFEESDKSWFELKGDHPKQYERITQYWRESRLFHEDEKIKTALFDWKPLPRSSVGAWPYTIENDLFTQAEYEKAYELREIHHSFLRGSVHQRLNLLEQILSTESFSILLSFGDRRGKERLLTKALYHITKQPVHFHEVLLKESKKKISVAEVIIGDKKRLIVCTPFFDSRSLTRKGLEELAQYLLPYFKRVVKA